MHVCTWWGASLWSALVIFAALSLSGGAALRTRSAGLVAPVRPASGQAPAWPALRVLGGLGGLAVGALALGRADSMTGDAAQLLWGASLLVLLPGLCLVLVQTAPEAAEPVDPRRAGAALWLLGLLAGAAALAIHRPDLDDAFYINVAAAAADHPARALLAGDTMHGVADLPLHMPAHRLHSWELGNGLLARLTGLPAIVVFHLISAPLAALLALFANARLLRLIAPERWLAATAALLVVLLASGEAHRFHANFSFARMWQGKSVLLFVFVPLIYAAALQYGRRASPLRFAFLAAAQIAALGASSTAVWLGPATALSGLAATFVPTVRQLSRLALGSLSALYPLWIGLALRPALQEIAAPAEALLAVPAGDWLALSFETVLGAGPLQALSLAALAGAWVGLPSSLGMRFALTVPSAAFLILLDPYTEAFVASNLTGASIWRALWALPVPLFLALVLSAPLAFSSRASAATRGWARAARLGFGALLLGFALAVPRAPLWGTENRGAGGDAPWLGLPGLKVPKDDYRWAEKLTESAGPGALVIAPQSVAVWLPTFRGAVYPQLVLPRYLERFRPILGDEELTRRAMATRYSAGFRSPRNARAFEEMLARGTRAVLLRQKGRLGEAHAILARRGFDRVASDPSYELWVRLDGAPAAAGAEP